MSISNHLSMGVDIEWFWDGLLMECLGTNVRTAGFGVEDYGLSVSGLGQVTVPFCISVFSSEKWGFKTIPISYGVL